MPSQTGLPRAEVEALVKRFLDGEPAVSVQDLGRGLGFLCRPAMGDGTASPWLFAVATGGGVLLRLDATTRIKVIDNGIGEPNVALPEWVVAVPTERAPRGSVVGRPDEWVWVPIPDGTAFERRRPHIHEALAYGRHRLDASGL